MQPIRLLMARYGALATKSSLGRDAVARAISEASGVRVEASEVDLKEEGEVRVRLSGTRRAALFLKKEIAEVAVAVALGKATELK